MGEAVTAWSPLHHQGQKQHLHLVCLQREEFSVKCWHGENYDLGVYQAFVCRAVLLGLVQGAQENIHSSCGAG